MFKGKISEMKDVQIDSGQLPKLVKEAINNFDREFAKILDANKGKYLLVGDSFEVVMGKDGLNVRASYSILDAPIDVIPEGFSLYEIKKEVEKPWEITSVLDAVES